MGNVEFAPRLGDESFDVEVFGKEELSKVAKLLGISSTMLWQGITTRTHTIKGQPVKSMSDANMVSFCLPQSFYHNHIPSYCLKEKALSSNLADEIYFGSDVEQSSALRGRLRIGTP